MSNPFNPSTVKSLSTVIPLESISRITSDLPSDPSSSMLYTLLNTLVPKSETKAKLSPGIFSWNTPLLK